MEGVHPGAPGAVRIGPWTGTAGEAAAFLAPLNREPEHHIVFLDTDEAAVARSLRDFDAPLGEAFRAAWAGDSLVGMLGAECDLELGRSWLYGPFVTGGDWDGVADSLLAALEGALPAAVRQMDLAGDTRHAHLERFAERQGFAFFKEARVMNLERARFTGSAPPEVVPLRPALAESLAAVHDAAFPETYFRGDQLGSLDPAQYPILVTESGGRVSGYAMLEPDREGGSAFLHFVAVAESTRGTGLGRKLLDAVLARAFADPAVKVVSLTVEATNTAAIAWYERQGFATERSVIAYRKALPSSPSRPAG